MKIQSLFTKQPQQLRTQCQRELSAPLNRLKVLVHLLRDLLTVSLRSIHLWFFLIALATAVIPPSHSTEIGTAGSTRPLTLLVIACPCALVISTPVTIVTGLANAAKRGILVKGGIYLEKGRKTSAYCFRQDRHYY